MKVIPCEQNSLEWLMARVGVPTASEFDNIMTPLFVPRKGETQETYLSRKLAEWWLGGPLPNFNSIDMEFGKIKEETAIPWYEFEFSETIQTVGFVTDDSGIIGCSPDGLIGEDGGIEIKCPLPQTHCKYLMSGEVPHQYLAQVHGSMFVTGRPWWKFLSFCPRFPSLVLTVFRDEDIQRAIGDTLSKFLERFDKAKNKLEEMNGGPRNKPKSVVIQAEEPDADLIP